MRILQRSFWLEMGYIDIAQTIYQEDQQSAILLHRVWVDYGGRKKGVKREKKRKSCDLKIYL